MPGPVVSDARGGDVETLIPQQQSLGTAPESRPPSGLAGVSCPAVTTLPPAQPEAVLLGTNVSGAKAQSQDVTCYEQPPQAPAKNLPASAVPNAAATASLSEAGP